MTETTVSARVPQEIVNEIERIMNEEKLEKSAAIRKLIYVGLEQYRKQKAIELLRQDKVSFQKAAKIAGLNIWEFADLLKDKGIIWVKQSTENDLERVK